MYLAALSLADKGRYQKDLRLLTSRLALVGLLTLSHVKDGYMLAVLGSK